MENLFPKIVRIYRLHSTALAIDKYWYNSVQFKLPSTFFQALDWQLWRSYGFKKYIFMFSVNVHKCKKRAYPYIPRESKNRTPYNYAYNFAKYCPIFKILSPSDSVVNT